jgi:hypothetical protein
MFIFSFIDKSFVNHIIFCFKLIVEVLLLWFIHFSLSLIDCINKFNDFSNNLVDLQVFGFGVHEFSSPQMIIRFGSNIGVEGEEHIAKK